MLVLGVLAGCSGSSKTASGNISIQLVRPAVTQHSSGIFVTQDDRYVLAVNPDQNTVSVFDAQYDQLPRVCEIPVGEDPRSVTVLPSGLKAYVANAGSGTVSVLDLLGKRVIRTIPVATEPRGVAATPNGTRVYCVSSVANTLTCIDTTFDAVLWTGVLPTDRGSQPRSLAITNDYDNDDLDEKIYVPLFFAGLRAGKTGLDEGQDDNRQGTVVVVAIATNTIVGTIPLAPIAGTGFRSNGSVLDLVGTSNGTGGTNAPDPTNPATVTFDTGCFPNQLAAIALHPTNGKAYVVSTGASPNGPFGFNVNAQGMVSVFDTTTDQEVVGNASATVHQRAPLNLNQGIPQDTTNSPRLFLTNPVDIVWNRDGSEGWIAIQNSDVIVRVTVDANGLPTVNAPVNAGAAAITRIDLRAVGTGQIAGKAPRALAFNSHTDRLFVYNFVSRSVSVIDVGGRRIVGTVESAPLPLAGTPDATVSLGAELFFTGRGPQGRMSQDSWGGCVVCHPDGLTDTVTWMFDAGPRQTISLDGMFSRFNTHDQRILNWSAVRDENQDFELNTRGVFGGRGLIEDDRILMAIGGALGSTDSPLILEYHQLLNQFASTGTLAGQPLPALPTARRDHGAATLPDGRILVVGGRNGAWPGNLVTSDAVVCFDPRSNQIRTCSNVGFVPRYALGVAAVLTVDGPRVYAAGGYTSTTPGSAPTALVQEYNPRTDTWRDVAPLPAATAEFGIAVNGPLNKGEPVAEVHVLGGNTGPEGTPSVTGAVRRFTPDPVGLGAWRTLAFNITPRRNLGAAAVVRGVFPTHVFAIGGRDGSGVASTVVEEYAATTSQTVPTDPGALVATPITQLAAGRYSFAIGTSNNRIYIAGGVDAAGADLATTLEYNPGANPTGGTAGANGTPSGVFTAKANLPAGARGLTLSNPTVVANFQPVRNTGRDVRQDAIAEWVKRAVRSHIAPNRGSTAAAVVAGRALFQAPGLTGVSGVSCATCHGGSKWTRSIVDYDFAPSPDLGRGFEEIIGAELRRTHSQPPVLFDVGTFVAARNQEVRPNPADVGVRVAALGANGFNIPSLLSVHSTAPYYHAGIAATLESVLNGSFDGNGTSAFRSVHNVGDATVRANLIEFLKSIDETTLTVP